MEDFENLDENVGYLIITYVERVIPLNCQMKLLRYNVRDIDQTDLHRFEPSSRTLLWDEHSHQ